MADVLLVDDDNLVREVVFRLLDAMGHSVVSFDRPSKALAHIRSGEKFDLLITDVEMPGDMNGIDLARRVKEERGHLKVIFVTGHHDTELFAAIDPCLEFTVLIKPFRRRQLDASINQIMGS